MSRQQIPASSIAQIIEGEIQMKLRHAFSLFTGLAFLALATFTLSVPRASAQDTPDVKEVRSYKLTLAVAQRCATAMQSINQLTASNAAIKAQMDASSTGNLPITQQALAIDTKFPQVTAIIHSNGLQTREFIVITGALINDVLWVGMKKMGQVKSIPPGMITPENETLIEANWDQFQAIGAKLSPQSGR
jgi:hypothetical protein